MNWDLEKLQKTLNTSKKLIGNISLQDTLLKKEIEYQNKIKKFSPAYLSGCDWYVGPSLIESLKNKKYDYTLLENIFYYHLSQSK